MRYFTFSLVLCSFFLVANAAYAQERGNRFTPEQMAAVRACAAQKGVTMPQPPVGPPPRDGRGRRGKNRALGASSDKMVNRSRSPRNGGKRPRLTKQQRAIVDACFVKAGLTPPTHRRRGTGRHRGDQNSGQGIGQQGVPKRAQ